MCVCVCVCERERGYGHDTVTNMQDAYSLPQKCSLGQPKPDDNVTHLYGCTGGLLSSGGVGNPVSFRRSEGVHALHESPSEGAALQHARNVSKRETKRRKMATNRQRQPPFWVEVTSEFRNLGRPTTKRATKIDRLNPTLAGGAAPTSTPLTSVHQRVVPRPATNGSALGPCDVRLLSLSGGVGNLYSFGVPGEFTDDATTVHCNTHKSPK